jgi:hypothetical protein
MTGTLALTMAWLMARMELSRPPGVSNWMIRAAAFSFSAVRMPSTMKSANPGLMEPTAGRTWTDREAAPAWSPGRTCQAQPEPQIEGKHLKPGSFGNEIREAHNKLILLFIFPENHLNPPSWAARYSMTCCMSSQVLIRSLGLRSRYEG